LTYVEVLRSKRQTVLAEIEILRGEATSVATRISTKESQLHNLDDLLALEAGAEAPVPIGPERSQSSRSQRFIDAAFDVLKTGGTPLHYRILSERLSDGGVYVPGKDPAANLLAHMSRDQRFGRGPGRGVYGLAEWSSVRVATQGRRARARKPTSSSRPRRTPRG